MSGIYIALILVLTYKTRINETGKREINLIITNLLRPLLLPCVLVFGLAVALAIFLTS
jgi:hypothetical protein